MGDHRAGTGGSTAQPTGNRVARHSAEQVADQPYVGRRVAAKPVQAAPRAGSRRWSHPCRRRRPRPPAEVARRAPAVVARPAVVRPASFAAGHGTPAGSSRPSVDAVPFAPSRTPVVPIAERRSPCGPRWSWHRRRAPVVETPVVESRVASTARRSRPPSSRLAGRSSSSPSSRSPWSRRRRHHARRPSRLARAGRRAPRPAPSPGDRSPRGPPPRPVRLPSLPLLAGVAVLASRPAARSRRCTPARRAPPTATTSPRPAPCRAAARSAPPTSSVTAARR